jgi:hypothetical protein
MIRVPKFDPEWAFENFGGSGRLSLNAKHKRW